MTIVCLQLLAVGLSALVLAAHFLRAGNFLLVLASAAIIVLTFVRRSWAARLIQLGLVLGALEWLHTLVTLVSLRRHFGQPFARLAVILGAVAAVTTASALLVRTRTLRRYFGGQLPVGNEPGGAGSTAGR